MKNYCLIIIISLYIISNYPSDYPTPKAPLLQGQKFKLSEEEDLTKNILNSIHNTDINPEKIKESSKHKNNNPKLPILNFLNNSLKKNKTNRHITQEFEINQLQNIIFSPSSFCSKNNIDINKKIIYGYEL